METKKSKKLAGWFRQCLIVIWKNLLIYKSQKVGLVCELLFPLLSVGLAWLILDSLIGPAETITSDHLADRIISKEYQFGSSEKKLYYYPDNRVIGQIMKSAFVDGLKQDSSGLIGLNTSSPMINDTKVTFLAFPSHYDSWQAIGNSSLIEYTIYSTDNYKTDEPFLSKSTYMYYTSLAYECSNSRNLIDYLKFNSIRDAVDKSIIKGLAGREINFPNTALLRLKCADYYEKEAFLQSTLSFIFPTLISFSVLVSFLLNVSNIIEEKQARVKEYLKIMGGKSFVLTIGWVFKSYLIYLLLVACLFTHVLKRDYMDRDKRVAEFLVHTSWLVVFLTIHTFAIQVNSLSILVGQVFGKQFTAKTITIFVWLATLVNIFNYFVYPLKHLLAFFPNLGLAFCFETIFQYSRSGRDHNMSNLFSSMFEDDVSVGFLLVSMHLWSVFYLALGWYLEKVFPGEYGVKHPWYFVFLRSFWMSSDKKSLKRDEEVGGGDVLLEERVSVTARDPAYFEKEPTSLRATVRLQNLTKVFRVGFENKTAVNRLSLNFYENQITGFLGHNGAGKTTVTFMLCGLYSPTSGTAQILDEDIRENLNRVRTQIGFCPQTNILFDQLSVEQHLKLVCLMKGFSLAECRTEIDTIAKYVGLEGDLSKRADQLSGGMKRRLSVAMAFIGDSKVIILDEPTSGLDPYNRRGLWELIKNYKQQGKTILLTTHYMDEADALSDRIAIMSHGELKCCGSPLFLKSKFGSGYSLTFNKDPAVFDLEATNSLIKRCLNGAELKCQSDVAREICYSVPTSLTSRISELLNAVEREKTRLGILSYGIGSSSVEDVYIKVQDDGSDEKLLHELDLCKPIFDPTNNEKYTGVRLFTQRIASLLVKRARVLLRRYLILAFTFSLPFLVIFAAYFVPSSSSMLRSTLSNLLSFKTNMASIDLGLEFYGRRNVVPVKFRSTTNESIAAESQRLEELARRNFVMGRPSLGQVRVEKLVNKTVNERALEIRSRESYDLTRNNNDYIIGYEFFLNRNQQLTDIYMYFSSMAYHSNGVVLNELNSILLSYYTNSSGRRFKVTNAPFVQNHLNISRGRGYDINEANLEITHCFESVPFSILDYLFGVVIAFLISLACIQATRERVNKSKQLQIMLGGGRLVYWTSNYLFEFLVHLINITVMLATIVLLARGFGSGLNRNDHTLLTASYVNLFTLFGFLIVTSLSWSTLAYVWSFFFKSEMVAFVTLFMLLVTASFIDMVLALIYFFLVGFNLSESVDTTRQIAKYRTLFSALFPNVAAKRAVFMLKTTSDTKCMDWLNLYAQHKGENFDLRVMPLLVTNLIMLTILLILFFLIESKFLLTLFKDWCMASSRRKLLEESEQQLEEDVRQEKERVDKLYENDVVETVMVRDVVKMYSGKKSKESGSSNKSKYAVKELSFGVDGAECFGLLGLNGAGKTSTLKILIGELNSTRGQTSLNGVNARLGRRIPDLGYCPQFDYLPVFLSVWQCLDLFANLKGLEQESREFIIDKILVNFKLGEFKNSLVQNLSGGNKRKLSSAVAFLGCPKTVILDEPTAGMDPVSKRCLWNFIKSARDNGITILLTTHNMEESEALCTKLGIMVNGQFKCFGNIQHLKSKYGQGYTLIVKCKHATSTSPSDTLLIEKLEQFIKENIPNSVLTEKQEQTLFYQIQFSSGQNLARLFTLIENSKDSLCIETYSLSQTTLEQIFISFARAQVQQSEQQQDSSDEIINN